jgi:glycosyltransferase involved in cell wall biosynthesis
MIRLSAVIPTIGRSPYFDEALGSLLAQRDDFHEVVVFDNSEAKNVRATSRHASDAGVRWESSEGFLPALQSWNTAVARCRGDCVTIFGDDDVALPGFASHLNAALQRANFVLSAFETIDEHGKVIKAATTVPLHFTPAEFRHRRMRQQLRLVIPGVAFRREDFLKIGGFRDTHLPKVIYTDDDLWFRLAEAAGKVGGVEGVTWRYRWHKNQIGTGFGLRAFASGVDAFLDGLVNSLVALGAAPDAIFPEGQTREGYRQDLLTTRFQILWSRELEMDKRCFSRNVELLRDLVGVRLPFNRKYRLGHKAALSLISSRHREKFLGRASA